MSELYLSRLTMPLEYAMQKGYHTSYDWHQLVWLAFPGRENEKRDFLYRVDIKSRMVIMLLQSSIPPSAIGQLTFETKIIPESFFKNEVFRFQVRVNPTYRQMTHENKPGKRLALYKDADIREWFQRKLTSIGCEIFAIDPGPSHDEIFTKDGKRGKHVAVDATGVLKVLDHASFYEGVCKGIGSAKGFGYGLIMLQPIQL